MTPRHRDTTTPAPIEKKAWWATIGTFAASLVVALLTAVIAEPEAFGALPAWLVGAIIVLGPTVVQFLSAYAAPHTPRTDPDALRAAEQ